MSTVTVEVNADIDDMFDDLIDSGYVLAKGCTREDAIREITARLQKAAQEIIYEEEDEIAQYKDDLYGLMGVTDGLKTVTAEEEEEVPA